MSYDLLANGTEIPAGATAVPIHVLPLSEARARLRDRAGDAACAWAEAHGWPARPGSWLALPAPDGGIAGIALALSDAGSMWDLAHLPGALPPGFYRLADELPDLPARALGWVLGSYRFDPYRSGRAEERARARLVIEDESCQESVHRMADAIACVRDLINTPAGDLGPEEIEGAAHQLFEPLGAEITSIVGDDLLEANFPLIHAVGRASPRAPRLVDIRWGRPEAPRVTLVGKGVCFDTGGLDLKPSRAMLLMKKDMGGAAHALALGRLIIQAGLDVRLRVLVPTVDNAVSGNAFRPRDILPSRKGLNVEIGNTDAEGRLILADALTLAGEEDPPEVLIDFATLTGAARTALGPEIAPLFTRNDTLAEEILSAAAAAQDPMWRLPIWDGYAHDLESPVADLVNAGEMGMAGATTAALFLERFVPDPQAWMHFDVYGWNSRARPGRPVGGEAFALRAVFAMLEARYPPRS